MPVPASPSVPLAAVAAAAAASPRSRPAGGSARRGGRCGRRGCRAVCERVAHVGVPVRPGGGQREDAAVAGAAHLLHALRPARRRHDGHGAHLRAGLGRLAPALRRAARPLLP